jgi:hypothetical protein
MPSNDSAVTYIAGYLCGNCELRHTLALQSRQLDRAVMWKYAGYVVPRLQVATLGEQPNHYKPIFS